MALLNYTTKIDPDKTAAEITRCLTQHGAQAIMTEYDPSTTWISALSFKITVNEQTMGFRLPCDWQPVFQILQKDPKVPHANSTKDQAIRTAWRIVKDWVEAQMALVETKMVTTQQVFLPYVVMRDGRTLAEHVSTDPKFLLGGGSSA